MIGTSRSCWINNEWVIHVGVGLKADVQHW